LEELTDKYIGKRGTRKRDAFDNELRIDSLGQVIKQAREERKLTQEDLGKLAGVDKSQISKIENRTAYARFSTILKVFDALGYYSRIRQTQNSILKINLVKRQQARND
jgi:transcriptional regulator with XRE-family HTH domain